MADHSPFLKSLMTGQMKEAQENTAKLPNIDPSTFFRFAEYIYRGNYNVPGPVRTEIENAGSQAVDHTTSFERSTASLPPLSRRKVAYNQPFSPRIVKLGGFGAFPLPPVSVKTFPTILEPCVADESVQQDFTEAICCHARVYVMADYFQAQGLRDLAICKMHRTLKEVIQSEKKYVKNITSILEYSYRSTICLESTKDKLRDLMTHYVAWDFRKVMGNADFKAGLTSKTSDAFMVDICEKVSLRL